MNALQSAITIITGINAALLIALVVMYAKNLAKIKSKLLVGLMVFATVFLIQNLVSLYYYVTMMAYYVPEVEIHIFILTLLQTIAFSIMLWINME